ncbi:MAG: Smr/MutS family protein, partial [Longimicrobiales bacterium]
MSGHALGVLEFERVLDRVARRASSELGRERIRALEPRTDRDVVVRELGRVGASMRFRADRPDFGLGPVPDVGACLAQLATEGSALEGSELFALGVLLTTSRELRAELTPAGEFPELASIETRLVDLRPVSEAIVRSVDADGHVLDTASRDLKTIRDRLRGAHTKIVRKLEAYLGTLPERFVVPDGSVTIRDGRYVVPLRREGRGEVGGIVHGESQTGATVYVEPPVAIDLMNQLRDLEGEEAREVRRILRELTAQLFPHAASIRGAWDALVDFDSLDARARAAVAWDAVVPEIAADGARSLSIHDGRHPLLLEAREGAVVPFDLELEPHERALVISGPNTGGKSVLLKAVGLISSLAQSGVVPPVGPGTVLPIFDDVFADIGDEQSIARNLSTFSAHLANLADIVGDSNDRSLVLIDEMGTGTDPAEGAALARAVLEELVRRGATVLVTSHLGEMKRLDTEGSGIVNGSLHFDAERMEPTYRLVKGRPGRSYGLAIARRLGFPGAVLDRAEGYRDQGDAQMDELLARLERHEREARDLAEQLDHERMEAERLRVDVDARARSLREAERTADARAREDARKLLLEARAEVEEAIRTVQGAAEGGQPVEEVAREARRKVEQAAGRLRDPARKRGTAAGRAKSAASGKSSTPAPGDSVHVRSVGSSGRVVEVRSGRALVETGALRLEVPLDELELQAESPTGSETRPRRGGWRGPTRDAAPPIEVDLRGKRVDEMEAELTRALDEAMLGDLGELRIIHGKGTGALRQRVSELLAGDARVREFRMGGVG